jgi:hypothetical protein
MIMHHLSAMGWAFIAVAAFIGIVALATWVWAEIDRARDRAAAREWNKTLATMTPVPEYDGLTWDPPEPGWEFEARTGPLPGQGPFYAENPRESLSGYVREPDWPETGQASKYFFGTDLVQYDPEADAAEYMRKMNADTAAFKALLAAEERPALARA